MSNEYKEPFLEPILRRIRFNMVLKHIMPKSVVVDLGCGHTPNLLNRLETYIKKGVGIDPLIYKKEGKIRLISKFLTGRIPLRDNYADHVTLVAVLEHLDDPTGLLREAYRILKPGGTVLITTPSPMNKPLLEFLSFGLGIVSVREIAEHKTYFWKNKLVEALQDCGFTNIKHRYFEFFLNNFAVAEK